MACLSPEPSGDAGCPKKMSQSISTGNMEYLGVSECQRRGSSEELMTEPLEWTPYRKHSSGDLHSRLKTRKLLGVGETDDGDVHRSKLSQILGHSEQLYVRLPRGLRVWQFLTALIFSVIAIWALVHPRSLFRYAVSGEVENAIVLPVRLYGAALLGFAVVFWSTLRSCDRDVIRWSLLASTSYFVIQIIVTSMTLIEMGMFLELGGHLLSHHLFFAAISGFYLWLIGDKTTRSRPAEAASKKDLSPAYVADPAKLKKNN